MQTYKLHQIPGAELAKRALEVALVQEHSIYFGTSDTAQILAQWAKDMGLQVITLADMTIEVSKPTPDKVYQALMNKTDAEPEEKLLERVRNAKKRLGLINTDPATFSEETKQFLKMIIGKLALDFSTVQTLIQISLSITALSEDTEIKTQHLLEAVQYIKR
jgi:predicted ATPase with chaperone activity